MPPTSYDSWAKYHDLMDADRAPPFLAFYRSLVGARTESVLDLGCGTGTIAIALAGDVTGRVVGVDASAEMLQVAKGKSESLEWVQGHLRLPPWPGRSTLSYAASTPFSTCWQTRICGGRSPRRRSARAESVRPRPLAADLDYLRTPQTNRIARSVPDDRVRNLEIREDTRYDSDARSLCLDWRSVQAGKPEAT